MPMSLVNFDAESAGDHLQSSRVYPPRSYTSEWVTLKVGGRRTIITPKHFIISFTANYRPYQRKR